VILPLLVVSSALAGGFAERRFPEFRFSPDGAYLAVAAVDEEDGVYRGGKVLIWELSSGDVVMAHDQHVMSIQFHPTQPLLRVTHPYDNRDTPIEDFTFDLRTGGRSDVGAYPFAGWTDTPGEVYAFTEYEDLDGDGRRDDMVRRVPLHDAKGDLAVERVEPIDNGIYEQHLTVEHSWAQSVYYQAGWIEQSAATGEFWIKNHQALFRLGPSLDAAQRVSGPSEMSIAMGVDGRLIVVDWRLVVDTVAVTKRKLPKKLLLSDTVLPGSESVLMLSAEKDRFLVLSPTGELSRELHLEQPLDEDCYAGGIWGNDLVMPCSWHELTQRLAVHTPEGIRVIDTTTGADVALLDTGVDVLAIRAEERRLRVIEEEAERQRAVQRAAEYEIALEAREQAERAEAARPRGQRHLKVAFGRDGFEYSCSEGWVDYPPDMGGDEAIEQVYRQFRANGIGVLRITEVGPGGDPGCADSFGVIHL